MLKANPCIWENEERFNRLGQFRSNFEWLMPLTVHLLVWLIIGILFQRNLIFKHPSLYKLIHVQLKTVLHMSSLSQSLYLYIYLSFVHSHAPNHKILNQMVRTNQLFNAISLAYERIFHVNTNPMNKLSKSTSYTIESIIILLLITCRG